MDGGRARSPPRFQLERAAKRRKYEKLRINDPVFTNMMGKKFKKYWDEAEELNTNYRNYHMEHGVILNEGVLNPIIDFVNRVSNFVKLREFRKYFLIYLPKDLAFIVEKELDITQRNIYGRNWEWSPSEASLHPFQRAVNELYFDNRNFEPFHRRWDRYRGFLEQVYKWCFLRTSRLRTAHAWVKKKSLEKEKDDQFADDLYEMIKSHLILRDPEPEVVMIDD